MRISDWSSDVCASDLLWRLAQIHDPAQSRPAQGHRTARFPGAVWPLNAAWLLPACPSFSRACDEISNPMNRGKIMRDTADRVQQLVVHPLGRSEERRGGTEWDSTCKYRWSPQP